MRLSIAHRHEQMEHSADASHGHIPGTLPDGTLLTVAVGFVQIVAVGKVVVVGGAIASNTY